MPPNLGAGAGGQGRRVGVEGAGCRSARERNGFSVTVTDG